MDSTAKRVVYVVFMRVVVAVCVIGGSLYFYQHPNLLREAGSGMANRYLPASHDMPDVSGTATASPVRR